MTTSFILLQYAFQPETRSSSGSDIVGIISGVIGFILLICIFIMGTNIGAIKNTLNRMASSGSGGINYSSAYMEGELQEYLGNMSAALESYKKAYYLLGKYMQKNKHGDLEAKNKKMIEDKIKSLGAEPKQLK